MFTKAECIEGKYFDYLDNDGRYRSGTEIVEGMMCSCGATELSGLATNPENLLFDVCMKDFQNHRGIKKLHTAYFVFSDTLTSRKGAKFAKYLEDNKFAVVTSPGEARNPNTSRRINFWVAKIDRDAIWAWWKQTLDKELAKVKKAALYG